MNPDVALGIVAIGSFFLGFYIGKEVGFESGIRAAKTWMDADAKLETKTTGSRRCLDDKPSATEGSG